VHRHSHTEKAKTLYLPVFTTFTLAEIITYIHFFAVFCSAGCHRDYCRCSRDYLCNSHLHRLSLSSQVSAFNSRAIVCRCCVKIGAIFKNLYFEKKMA